MCSHWTLPVGGESFQHPLMFLDDPVVGEGGYNLKQEPWLHTKMAFTYFTVPKMVGGRSRCAYFSTYFLYKFVWVSVVRCTCTIRCWKHEATVPLQTELESLKKKVINLATVMADTRHAFFLRKRFWNSLWPHFTLTGAIAWRTWNVALAITFFFPK
jgi:hypothetical protein